MPYRLTSLLLVEERLLEAAYFAGRLRNHESPVTFGYELNAFLSAARSVSWLLQKEMTNVPGFAGWWARKQTELSSDAAARFFVKLRNFSQKEGRVSVIGNRDKLGDWTYSFGGNEDLVPKELLLRDVGECCEEHVAKLARLTLACADAFPFHTCPRRALTIDGLSALNMNVADVLQIAGFPKDWIDAAPTEIEQCLRILQKQVDGVDFEIIQRLSEPRDRPTPSSDNDFGKALHAALVRRVESRPKRTGGKIEFIEAVLEAGWKLSDDK